MKKVKIHYSLYLMFLLSLFLNCFFEMFLMFTILLLHELGHLIFLKKYKREITSISFYMFGGVIKHSQNINSSIKEDFLINFGGILVNLILIFIFHAINFQLCLLINFSILIFNILPIYPLDGAKIIKTILSNFFCYKKTMYITSVISFIICITLFISNLFVFKSYYIVFLLIALIHLNIKYFNEIKKEYTIFLTNKFLYPNDSLKIKKIKKFKEPLNKLFFGKNAVFVIDDVVLNENELLIKYFSK